MLDFTSVLYLGFRHPSTALAPWSQLTTGVPAALAEPRCSSIAAVRLARLQGCQHAVIAPSTLHLFWDLFTMLAKQRIAIYLDSGAYPIAGWATALAASRGVPVHPFHHGEPDALAQHLSQDRSRRRPVIVADGLCSGCGCVMPIDAYAAVVRQWGGLLVLDDTQALGLLGSAPKSYAPYGHGGGGTLRHLGLFGPDLLLISSLAKGFGTPLAVLSGDRSVVKQFVARSKTRVHNSYASMAAIHAAGRALALNQSDGDRRRRRLAQRVKQFRQLAAGAGLKSVGGWFPIQSLRLPPRLDVSDLHRYLLEAGVRPILRRACDGRLSLSFSITTTHRTTDLVRTVHHLQTALGAIT